MITASQLEALMIEQFGEDFRSKAIAGPLGCFLLADAFAECGLQDPHPLPLDNAVYGLWQMTSWHT